MSNYKIISTGLINGRITRCFMAGPYTGSTPQQFPLLPLEYDDKGNVVTDASDADHYISAEYPSLPYGINKNDHPEHNSFATEYNGEFVKSCQHEPVNVGFNRAKIVCKKCDMVLEE